MRVKRPHKQEIEAIRKLLALIGGHLNLLHQGGKLRGTAGIPDTYIQLPKNRCMRESVSLWLEVKVGRDKPRPKQLAFADREMCAGNVPVIFGGYDELVIFLRPYLHSDVELE